MLLLKARAHTAVAEIDDGLVVLMTMVAANGLKQNMYAEGLIDGCVVLEDLFKVSAPSCPMMHTDRSFFLPD